MSFSPWLDKMSKHLDDFTSTVLPFPYSRKGIWTSEGFAVCSLSSIFKIDYLLESGILRGRSTEIFAKYGLSVISMDLTWNDSMSRFGSYENVQIKIGDSNELLPKLVRKLSKHKLGIFIDGPKGAAAAALAKRLFPATNIAFIGIHDQRIGVKHSMSRSFENVIYTDEQCFRDRFGYLDKEEQATPVPDHLPDPRGPTVGFVLKS